MKVTTSIIKIEDSTDNENMVTATLVADTEEEMVINEEAVTETTTRTAPREATTAVTVVAVVTSVVTMVAVTIIEEILYVRRDVSSVAKKNASLRSTQPINRGNHEPYTSPSVAIIRMERLTWNTPRSLQTTKDFILVIPKLHLIVRTMI